jgi:FecR protein
VNPRRSRSSAWLSRQTMLVAFLSGQTPTERFHERHKLLFVRPALPRPLFHPSSLGDFRRSRSVLFFLLLVLPCAGLQAVQLKEARVSQVIRDVRLLPEQAAPRPARVSDEVRHGTAVRTGLESRAELTFTDATLARLGANTIFSFDQGTRNLQLGGGAMLLRVPKNDGGAQINTAAITAAITGTTMLIEYHPDAFCKYIMLEGVARIFRNNKVGESVLLHAGQMLIVNPNGKGLPEPVDVDLERLMKTSLLITGFPPLLSTDLIASEIASQTSEKRAGGLIDTNLVIFGQGTAVSLLDPTHASVLDQANSNAERQSIVSPSPSPSPTPPPMTPTPTPGKYGTLTTISTPNPYVINSGTTIQTDPAITTNGVTDFGKIYRGATDDGAFTLWAFGSTSAFDAALGIDDVFFADPNHLPIATFKFQNLSLTGNPTIDLSNGGGTKLALIGVDGITSGPPGGTLTFTGLDLLALATVNGSINLTSDVSFQDLKELAMYARGAGSDLILDSPISNIGILELAAEGSIQLTNPGTMSVGEFDATAGNNLTLQIGSLLLDGKVRLETLVLPGATVATGANLTLNTTGDYTNSSATEFSLLQVTNQGHIGSGGNISMTIGGDLTATGPGSATEFPEPGDLELLVQNTNAQIDDGGNLNLTVNGNVQVNGLAAYLQNYDETANPAGHIGTGGNIDIAIGGNLTANSYVDVFLNNRGGMIDSGGNLTFNIGGALNVGPGPMAGSGYVDFVVSTRYDDSAGNTTAPVIGSDVSLLFQASSVNITLPPGPDTFFSTVIGNRGGTIDGNASVNFIVSKDINVLCDTDIDILNDGGPLVLTPFGGTIHGDATLQLSVVNLTANSLTLGINNRDGGVIDLAATVSGNITGDLTTSSDATFIVQNQRAFGSTTLTGGSIGGDASVTVAANNFLVGGLLDLEVRNRNNGVGSGVGGSIGGNAAVNVNIDNSVSSGRAAFFQIVNESDVTESPGGSIGGDATVDVSLGSFTSSSDVDPNALVVQIDNRGGSLGGNATINFAALGNVDGQGNVLFQIFNFDDGVSGGGTIGGSAILNVIANDITTSSLFNGIFNSRGSIGSDANATFNLTGDLTSQASAEFSILNNNDGSGSGGGTIGGNATVTVDLGNITSSGPSGVDSNALVAQIDNRGGDIGANAIVNFAATGNVNAEGNVFLQILNFDDGASGSGTINGDAILNVSAANFSSASFLYSPIDNSRGGSIMGSANLAFVLTGDLATQTDADLEIQNANYNGINGGAIGGDAILNFTAGGDINAPGNAIFRISNDDAGNGTGGGMIAENAEVNVSATNISAGILDDHIANQGGSIGLNANVTLNLTGSLTTQADAFIQILNFDDGSGSGAGTIGSDATITLNATNITANSLFTQIDNTGGSIGGTAAIDLNVSGTATVTSDATIEILGSDGAASAAININGGSYDAGGTFLALIDGNGAITFNNASAHADVLKVGALGNNGTLTIGGGTLSGDTTLKLYAGGSNGSIDFVANVSLRSLNDVAIIAANTVTIENGVVVTTSGIDGVAASVFTNVPNYTGSGGNGTKTGMFAGDGAVTNPFDQAPPFDAPGAPDTPPTGSTTAPDTTAPTPPSNPGLAGNRGTEPGAIVHHGPRPIPLVRVADSNELLDLVEKVTSGPTEIGHHRSNAPAVTGSVLSGTRRRSPSARPAPTDRTFSRLGARRPAALP